MYEESCEIKGCEGTHKIEYKEVRVGLRMECKE